ncbi:Gfo/Idh/MocA family protein [Paenibacillus nasutitermitis]|uniref:Oxidoreductase n=1 Tax=Paenibacillus nasutitermitis TaxID=1652958 RepID=A0A917E1V0_9BACL|nr:Gfo/Idh/MocA family oxidoreductase [Paenibacillus nasutitermitis]GGD95999.1 oxidoreductase [Paenibacillus nasutitermitis]
MKLNIIQVGLGAHGQGVGEHFVMPSPDFIYSGLVDINPNALAVYANKNNLPQSICFTDHEQAFRETESDAVFISAFSPVHYEIAKSALKHGLHVLIEKPFVLTVAEADELNSLAALHGCNIMINQNYRYFTSVLTLKQALQDSRLGKMLFVQSSFFYDHDGKPYQKQMDNYTLLEMSVHHVDMIRFLVDSDIAEVSGKTWNHTGSGYAGDPHVHAVYTTESGVSAFYLSSLLAGGVSMPWEGVWRFQFEGGSVHLDDLGDGFGVYIADGTTKTKAPMITNERESIHGVLHEFASSIREKRDPSISGKDNVRTLSALLATAESSRQGRTIHLSSTRTNQ